MNTQRQGPEAEIDRLRQRVKELEAERKETRKIASDMACALQRLFNQYQSMSIPDTAKTEAWQMLGVARAEGLL